VAPRSQRTNYVLHCEYICWYAKEEVSVAIFISIDYSILGIEAGSIRHLIKGDTV